MDGETSLLKMLAKEPQVMVGFAEQVALAVTPMISGWTSEILLAKSGQGLSKVVQSRIWQGNPAFSKYAPRLKRPKEGVHILSPGKSRCGGSTRNIVGLAFIVPPPGIP